MTKDDNWYYPRKIESRVQSALKQFPVVLITGPRQAGKSTLLQHCLKDYRFVSLDDPFNKQLAQNDPALFLSQYNENVIIDEIQYAPQLFDHLKGIIDKDRRNYGRFVLTGSQTFQLMQGVSETLAGRIAIFELYPLSWEEILSFRKKSSSVPTQPKEIIHGFYPEFFVNEHLDAQLWHDSYLSTYIERDVRNIRSIADLSRFQRFVVLLAARAGKLLNIAEIAKEAGISQPTAKDWLSVMESTYVIHLLPPYYNNQTKRLVKSPKLYFVDTGILCHLLGIDTYERFLKSPDRGSIFENMVIMDAIKRAGASTPGARFYFYRTSNGVEVDLICEHHNQIDAYEIKCAQTISKSMVHPLQTLSKTHNINKKRLVSLETQPLPLTQDIHNLHWSQILKD